MSPRAAAFAALALLAGCAAGSERSLPAGSEAALYARGLEEISDLYVKPVSPRQLALAGAARLRVLDGAIELSERGEREQLVLRYDGRDLGAPPTPQADDARAWGSWLAAITAAAKQASGKIAAVPPERIDKVVFDGITGPLDRYSRYSPPELARAHRAARDGFGGIGVTLAGDDFRISEVIPQSPADLAGLRPDDRITAIDGTPTAGRAAEEIVHEMRGGVATPVTVTVTPANSGEQPRELRLERALVTAPTVSLSRDGRIAIVRVTSFNHTTRHMLAASLKEAEGKAGGRLAGVILDLRGNPGGLLDQGVGLADLLIHDGPISAATGRNPASRQYFAAHGDDILGDTPVAVLINGDTASSAEIVAAALQDAGRAVVIGSASYGKGTIQTVVHLPNQGELTVTWAWLLAPSGYLLQGHGVVPTLCTADLADGEPGLQTALQRARATGSGPATPARVSLDEAGWTALRRSCPPRPGRPAVDVQLAEQLLADPKLYLAALHAIGSGGRLKADGLPAGPSLTESGATLSSNLRLP